MQRTIKVLRIALPIVFFGFLLFIASNWTRRERKPRENAAPVVSTKRPHDKGIAESVTFEDTQTIGGRVVSRIRAKRVVAFASDWNTLEGVELTIYRPNGLTYELLCPQAQFNAKTKEADATGGVKVTSSDGIMISTAEIKFDGTRLSNQIPVQFRIDQWNGNAGALDLDVEAETLKLWKKVTATTTPATPVEAPMTLEGEEGLFRRRENDVTFTQNVVLTRSADRVRANQMAGKFSQDRKKMVGLEGIGNVVIVMADNLAPGEDLGGRKTVTCDRFFSEVTGDGQLSAINAVGESALVHAVLDGPPKRDIVTRAMRIAIQQKAVHELKAMGEVVMKELAEVQRELKADNVTVNFDPIRHRPTSAYLAPFRYKDPKTQATAFRGHYDILGDRLVLTTDPGFDATVISEGHTIKAKQIEFAPRAQTARASGSVIAQLVSKSAGPTADSTNLFPSGKPVFVNADTLVMRQQNKVAVFTGNVKAWQETNALFANELHVQGAGNTMTARGAVRAVLYDTGEHRKIPLVARGDELVARKADRRMDFNGDVKIDDVDRTLTAEKSSFFFDARNKIERIEADQKVVFTEKPTNRKGTGDKAVYQIPRKLVMMSGNPAVVTGPQGSVNGQQIAIDLARNRVEIVSPTGATQGTYKHTQ